MASDFATFAREHLGMTVAPHIARIGELIADGAHLEMVCHPRKGLMLMATCGSCHAPVTWAHNDKTGKRAPLDAAPNSAGNCVILRTLGNGEPEYHVLNKDDREHERYAELQHYTTHFQTCAHADRHRRPR